jgi:hypothetical protein
MSLLLSCRFSSFYKLSILAFKKVKKRLAVSYTVHLASAGGIPLNRQVPAVCGQDLLYPDAIRQRMATTGDSKVT